MATPSWSPILLGARGRRKGETQNLQSKSQENCSLARQPHHVQVHNKRPVGPQQEAEMGGNREKWGKVGEVGGNGEKILEKLDENGENMETREKLESQQTDTQPIRGLRTTCSGMQRTLLYG